MNGVAELEALEELSELERPCSCTIACIPQGLEGEQVCREWLDASASSGATTVADRRRSELAHAGAGS